jgi:hypothetical protein
MSDAPIEIDNIDGDETAGDIDMAGADVTEVAEGDEGAEPEIMEEEEDEESGSVRVQYLEYVSPLFCLMIVS